MRYKELDIARGFTVMLMPAVHVTMLYGNEAVYRSWLGAFLNWIAVFPGAQLFMLLMGISFSLAEKKSFANSAKQINPFHKPLRWLFIAYALNAFKFLIPAMAGWLPAAFYTYLNLSPGRGADLRLFLLGDILQFATVAIIVLDAISRSAHSNTFALILCMIVICLSPFAWRLKISGNVTNELLSLISGNDSLVFFPVFPWLVYPLAGFLTGRQHQKVAANYIWLCSIGLILMLPQILFHGINDAGENLYRSLPLQTLFHLGFCFVWISLCAAIQKKMGGRPFFIFLQWCSRHITLIYFLQWVLIFWCTRFLPYRGLNIAFTLLFIALLSAIIFTLTYWIVTCASNSKTVHHAAAHP